VVCELTHLATLYHDDVMDEAAVRRGAPSANSRWTNSIAILTGDLLFARASDLLADLGPEAVRIQARTFERLVTGQIRETVGAQPGDDPVGHYLEVLADKTGSLVATSARFGARVAGVDAELVETDGLADVNGVIDVAIANPPYIIDTNGRTYRDGGDMRGARLSLDMAREAAERLTPGGQLLLYTGSAIVDGRDELREALAEAMAAAGCTLDYRELGPDVFGEELERPEYADVDRIALVGAAARKQR